MKKFSEIGATVLGLVWGFTSMGSTQACMLEPTRAQHATEVRLGRQADPMRLSDEMRVEVGDLVSLLVLKASSVTEFTPEDERSQAVVKLTDQQYKALSTQGGGRPHWKVETPMPSFIHWKHWTAAQPGVVYFKVFSKMGWGFVRVQIDAKPEPQRGILVQLKESQQAERREIGAFDTLTFELPGTPSDGWQVFTADVDEPNGGDDSGNKTSRMLPEAIRAVEALQQLDPTSGRRVLIRTQPGLQWNGPALELRSSQGSYRFMLRRSRVVPVC